MRFAYGARMDCPLRRLSLPPGCFARRSSSFRWVVVCGRRTWTRLAFRRNRIGWLEDDLSPRNVVVAGAGGFIGRPSGRRVALRASDLDVLVRHLRQASFEYRVLFALAAAPLASLPGFQALFGLLDRVDATLLRVPLLRRFAWQVLV